MDRIVTEFSAKVRSRLKDKVKRIILFGSRARGNAGDWSDYDFAVIVDKRTREVEEAVNEVDGELFGKYSRLIGSIIWDEAEWEERKPYPIRINIMRDGIEV